MNDVQLVHVFRRLEQLSHEIGGLGFGESFPSFDHFVETLVVTQFEENVTIVSVLKVVFKGAHVTVFEGSVDLDFCLQLYYEKGGEEKCVVVCVRVSEWIVINQTKSVHKRTFCRDRALTRLALGTTLTA